MNDTATPRRSFWYFVVAGVVVLACAGAALYLMTAEPRNAQNGATPISASAEGLPEDLATGEMAAFIVHKTPQAAPEVVFTDADGKEHRLADWRGKTVLVNLWATWCAPCREEMPALDKLQETYGGDRFEVVAISIDQKGPPAARAFLDEIGVDKLALYADPSTKALASLKGVGLPTTVLLDPEGRELGRLLGPAVWDSSDAMRLIEAALGGERPQS